MNWGYVFVIDLIEKSTIQELGKHIFNEQDKVFGRQSYEVTLCSA